jgi:hypothetical protein
MAAPVLDSTLGWVYIGLTTAWTIIVLCGMIYLYRHRRLPFLQIRRLPLVFASVIILHLYGACAMCGLVIGALIPCDAQFWIMSIYLPFSMALLQTANSQFFYVADQQRKYARFNNIDEYTVRESALPVESSVVWWKWPLAKLKRMDKVNKIVVYVGLGMAVNVSIHMAIFPFLRWPASNTIQHQLFRTLSILAARSSIRHTACSRSWCPEPSNSVSLCASRAGSGKSGIPQELN